MVLTYAQRIADERDALQRHIKEVERDETYYEVNLGREGRFVLDREGRALYLSLLCGQLERHEELLKSLERSDAA